MSTSGVSSWPLTAQQVVTQACYELGTHSAGETPSGEEMEDGILRLNAMLKTWQGEGNLFRETIENVTITGGNPSVAAPDGTRDVSSIRYVSSATNKRLLTEWNRGQYYSIPNRAQTSSSGPAVYYLAKSTTGLTINVWPVPSADATLELDLQTIAQTVTDPSETVDVPEEWQEALILGLASRMASMMGATRTDPQTVARIDSRAAALYQRLLDRDRPDSYIFETDC